MATSLSTSRISEVELPPTVGRRFRHAYSFDDVAIVPGTVTVDPSETDLSWQLGPHRLRLPILASAMDGVVDPSFARQLGMLGGLAVLNLEGLQTRYDDAEAQLSRVAGAAPDTATALLQELYQAPLRDDLVARRIQE